MDNAFITNVFITITFFLPGFVAKFLADYVRETSNGQSDGQITIFSLIWNIPSIFIGWAVASWIKHSVLGVDAFLKYIQSLPVMVTYFVGAFLINAIIGILVSSVVRWILTKRLKKIRTTNGLPNFTEGMSWEEFIGNEDTVVMKIYPIGAKPSAIAGYLLSAYKPGDVHRGVALINTGKMEPIVPVLSNPTRSFIEFDSQLVFELYTIKRLEEIANRAPESASGAPHA